MVSDDQTGMVSDDQTGMVSDVRVVCQCDVSACRVTHRSDNGQHAEWGAGQVVSRLVHVDVNVGVRYYI